MADWQCRYVILRWVARWIGRDVWVRLLGYINACSTAAAPGRARGRLHPRPAAKWSPEDFGWRFSPSAVPNHLLICATYNDRAQAMQSKQVTRPSRGGEV